MSISILNRGASSGMKPELTVTAPAGSTLDLLLNGIIVDTYTLGASETEHTFVVELGTYTVRGTLGADTTSQEVLIDAVGQYTVEISYFDGTLYDNGDEYEEFTGGWDGIITDSSRAMYQYSRNATNMSYSSSGGYPQTYYTCTENEIDLTGYTKIEVDYDFYTASASTNNWRTDIVFQNVSEGLPVEIILIHDFKTGSANISGVHTYSLPEGALNTKRQVYFRGVYNWSTYANSNATIRRVRLLP